MLDPAEGRADLVGGIEQHAKRDGGPGDPGEPADILPELVLQEGAEADRGYRGEDDLESQASALVQLPQEEPRQAAAIRPTSRQK